MNIYQAPDKIKVPWDTEVSAGSQIFDRPSIIQMHREAECEEAGVRRGSRKAPCKQTEKIRIEK